MLQHAVAETPGETAAATHAATAATAATAAGKN